MKVSQAYYTSRKAGYAPDYDRWRSIFSKTTRKIDFVGNNNQYWKETDEVGNSLEYFLTSREAKKQFLHFSVAKPPQMQLLPPCRFFSTFSQENNPNYRDQNIFLSSNLPLRLKVKVRQPHFSSITCDSNSTDKREVDGALISLPSLSLYQCSDLRVLKVSQSCTERSAVETRM